MTPHPNRRERSSLPAELRRAPVGAGVREWIAASTGSSVLAATRLPGASSTAVHRITLADGRRLVLRRYVWPRFLVEEPIAPQRELDALHAARSGGLPAPVVVAADPGGAVTGVPTVLMSLLAGRARGDADPAALAAAAARVHDVVAPAFPHRYFPWYAGEDVVPAGARRPRLWEAAASLRTSPPPVGDRFVHRDFHPGNVLWSRNALTGIVDWANACLGPWECDVAHCRANLIDLGGDAVADAFLRHYLAITGWVYDPYWEIASVLEHGPSHCTPPQLDEGERRLEVALAARGQSPHRPGRPPGGGHRYSGDAPTRPSSP